VAATTGLAALAGFQADAEIGEGRLPNFPIVDTHQHLWDLKKFRPPWLRDEPKLNVPSFLPEYAAATRGLNVTHTVYMEVDVDPRQQVEEAEFVTELCRSHRGKMAAAVISCRPASPAFKNYAMRFKGSPYVKGMRQVLQVPSAPRGFCLRPEYVRSVRLMGDLGLSFDICIRPEELSDAAKLIDLCPHTRFIVDHCGNANAQWKDRTQWEEDIAQIARRDNVVCKVSGVIKTCKPGGNFGQQLEPIVNRVIDEFGTDRVMFGSDWPVCNLTSSYRGWVETLAWIVRDRTPEEKRKLFHDNAIQFYRLKA
jgi:predicted TIM-barrel fold metal-dependent hydrolase